MDEKGQDITSEQVDKGSERPKESALDLKAIRESKGLTLRDVSASTRISPPNLKAIEEQRFELLPEPIYARAFIDTYARVLDIDSGRILPLYETYIESLEPDQDSYEVLKNLSAKRYHTEIRIWAIIVSGLLALIGAFYIYQCSMSDRQERGVEPPAAEMETVGEVRDTPEGIPAGEQGKDEPQPSSSMAETDQAIKEDARPAVVEETPGPDTVVPAAEKAYTLVIEASEMTWIQIAKDGEPLFEVMLRPGERITERASKGFNLTIGNAGGVDIRFQEKSLGPLGKHGEVIHLALPADE